MAWTAPRTWVTGEPVTAALLNAHLRDNFLETMVAKVTTLGDLAYATAANALARLGIGAAGTALKPIAGVPAWSNIGVPVYTRKTADESVANTTFQNDDHLFQAIGANEVWEAVFVLTNSGGAGGSGAKFAVDVPTGATLTAIGMSTGSSISNSGFGETDAASFLSSTSDNRAFIIHVFVINGANAGNIQLQWALASGATSMTVEAGSYLKATRVS